MTTLSEYSVDFPQWALYYITYGEDDSLSLEEIHQIEEWQAQFYKEAKECGGHVIFSPTGKTNEFCRRPEFGLACSTEEMTVLICK